MDTRAGWGRSMEAPGGCWQPRDCAVALPLEEYFCCFSRASHQLPFAVPASPVKGIGKVAFQNYRYFKMKKKKIVKGKEHLQDVGIFSEMEQNSHQVPLFSGEDPADR